MALKAVFFDMDGLVLDSEKVFYREFHKALIPRGIDIPMDKFVTLLGRTNDDISLRFHEMYPDFENYDEFSRQFDIDFQKTVSAEAIPVKKGFHELIEALRARGIRKYIVTSSYLSWANTLLKNAGVYDLFDEIITGEMVENSKPAPDMYLHAMDVAGASADECLVLEDSIAGCMSSVNAGIRVICVPDLVIPPDEVVDRCYMVAASLEDVIPLIDSM
ncbi:MAG: HAD family phosphatase [Oscillospiraceae bacterium]|nr:HAD family phosphatase [Oscillospiraceae bacterium]